MKNLFKKNYMARIFAIVVIVLMTFAISITAFAAEENAADTAAPAAQSEAVTEETAEEATSSNGLGLVAAAIVTGIAGVGGGIAIAAAAPAAIAATSEDPKSFGKSLIFVALGESIVLFGFVVSILILNKV